MQIQRAFPISFFPCSCAQLHACKVYLADADELCATLFPLLATDTPLSLSLARPSSMNSLFAFASSLTGAASAASGLAAGAASSASVDGGVSGSTAAVSAADAASAAPSPPAEIKSAEAAAAATFATRLARDASFDRSTLSVQVAFMA